MIRDLADYSRWTEQYKNDPLGSANNKINDAYLKHNGQTAGVNSYNDVAELLIAFESGNEEVKIHTVCKSKAPLKTWI